ncbi:peptidoglycan D,D-transpeptidase FtsI family protein [Companilactobacillus sp.]|jgi:cell division protein FtsI/penicillin-binding protein 2|uniref:peptidoglycan D,D-transpeptidase FtsI family protein n=1 Tax=Companilactobacillus sp. TaxID=2767905 RepID=UPI0025B9716B|nr:penicillin-binding protein 2 [Companilactobacillus sp.]MCH4008005.1 penicillin-binding protein 2 [Companilactobacillus sp.]MCH4051816.1 penicillin-binding protein 2 [Companilactobacillus sp.]MCH4075948.1 penicillin-binding protein 2 [Companilactobacillus sp.]MCH4124523.1 penicillin-binding protein 2 [Companilactobacillus sp.]MCH4132514.1 penicillin-binding protein 2 [Companilactobacillus sp.]
MKRILELIRKRTGSQAKSTIPFRLNLLFFIVFALFALLVGQLAYLQIVYGGKFQAEVDRTDKTVMQGNVPRGMIYDSKGRLLVGNSTQSAITYTKSAGVKTSDIYQIVNRLTQYVNIKKGKLTERDKADYILAAPNKSASVAKQMPKSYSQDSDGNAYSANKIYANEVKYIQEQGIHLSNKELAKATAFKTMSSAYSLSTVFVKDEGLTSKEIAQVSEHLTELPGISVGSNWNRDYPQGKSIASIIGGVSTEQEGIPNDELNIMLASGYSRNDRVGTSYLEKSYESILAGTKSQRQVAIGSNNQIKSSKEIYAGQKGGNLNLTIDSAFQKKVQSALDTQFAAAKGAGITQYSDGAYAVAMNPKTGAILAMAGTRNDTNTGKTTEDSLGVINRTFVMGSAVKGATVLGALMDGVITPDNNTLPDQPIYLPGTPVKKSVYPIGTYSALSAEKALQVSSNEYMMALAIKEGKATYTPNTALHLSNDVFDVMRGYFNQFGLGVKTGIDISGETTGIEGASRTSDGQLKTGSALDLSYGNYDAYTLIEMAQYISTIANGGYRMRPYIVQSVQKTQNDGKKGAIESVTKPKVLNRVGFTDADLRVVKNGMYNVVHGTDPWTTGTLLKDISPSVSAKTGTAQSFYYNPEDPNNPDPPATITTSLVSFGPSDDPNIALAIVFPNLSSEDGNYPQQVAKQIYTDYYKMTNQSK